ncbi:MAG TPA: tetratricopeptide repeat protein [Myxococcales bacterium]|nr:tetratricopeptide repeat protein [Myxococcales bacterium]
MKRLVLAATLLAGCATTTQAEQAHKLDEEGLALLDDGKPCEGLKRFQHAMDEQPDDLEPLRHSIRAARECGRLEVTTAAARDAVTKEPGSARAHYVLGLCLLAGTRGEGRGIDELLEAHRLAPKNAEFALRAGLALLDAERFAEAVAPLREAAALSASDPHPHFPLAVALHHVGQDEAAIAEIGSALSLEPSEHDLAEARKLIDLIHDPYRVLPEAARGKFSEGLGWLERVEAPQRAVDIFEELQSDYPQVAGVQSALGLAYERMGDNSEAVEHFERAAQLDPSLPEPHLYLGELYYGLRRYDQAIEQYRAALREDPLLGQARERLAQLSAEGGDLATTVAQLRAVVALHGGDAQSRLALADALAAEDDLRGAESQLQRILDGDGKNLQAKLSLAAVLERRAEETHDVVERRRRAQRARALAEQVLAVQPDNVTASRVIAAIDKAK